MRKKKKKRKVKGNKIKSQPNNLIAQNKFTVDWLGFTRLSPTLHVRLSLNLKPPISLSYSAPLSMTYGLVNPLEHVATCVSSPSASLSISFSSSLYTGMALPHGGHGDLPIGMSPAIPVFQRMTTDAKATPNGLN
jgi:hypothetical protein